MDVVSSTTGFNQMDSNEIGVQKINFRSWMVEQVTSGKYHDLEWIDEDHTIFKLPWTKKHYPYWEEHHEIFKAWAKFRAHVRNDPKIAQMPISALKSNFRTVLNKCSEIEQMKDYHQLNLQTGNYKVYKVLSTSEIDAKRKRKRKVEFDVIEITSTDENIEGLESINQSIDVLNCKLPDSQISEEWSLATRTVNLALLNNDRQSKEEPECVQYKTQIEIVQDLEDVDTDVKPPQAKKSKSTISTQTDQTAQQTTTLTAVVEEQPMTMFSEEVHEGACEEVETTVEENKGGFHMLLEAAELAGSPVKRRPVTVVPLPQEQQQPVEQQQPPVVEVVLKQPKLSIEAILDCLNIPRERLHTYHLVVKYRDRIVVDRDLTNMATGYRIHSPTTEMKEDDQQQQQLGSDIAQRISILLPNFDDDDVDDVKHALNFLEDGIVICTNNNNDLCMRRLCQSDKLVFFNHPAIQSTSPATASNNIELFSSSPTPNFGSTVVDAMSEHSLFSYGMFLSDCYNYHKHGVNGANSMIRPPMVESSVDLIVNLHQQALELPYKTPSDIGIIITPCAARDITLQTSGNGELVRLLEQSVGAC